MHSWKLRGSKKKQNVKVHHALMAIRCSRQQRRTSSQEDQCQELRHPCERSDSGSKKMASGYLHSENVILEAKKRRAFIVRGRVCCTEDDNVVAIRKVSRQKEDVQQVMDDVWTKNM